MRFSAGPEDLACPLLNPVIANIGFSGFFEDWSLGKNMHPYRIAIVNCGMDAAQPALLEDRLASCTDFCRTEPFADLGAFLAAIQRPTMTFGAAIFLVSNQAELDRLLFLGNRFPPMKVLVVLSGRLYGAMVSVHRLSPRYIGFLGEGYDDLVAVMKNIAQRAIHKTVTERFDMAEEPAR